MAYAVSSAFEVFRGNIEPQGYDRDTATKRKDHLISLLQKDFHVLDAFATGSLPRYTAVKDHADLDIVVVLHYGKHIQGRKPSEVLRSVRESLGETHTNIKRNGQAVTLYYRTWPDVDVVPVSVTNAADGSVAYYNVPDMNREAWIVSKPQNHTDNLSRKNGSYGPEFKRIIKMIKWWNHQHNGILQSFHIEVVALLSMIGAFSSYPWDIYRFFDQAVSLVSAPLVYDLQAVDAYLEPGPRKEVVDRLATAKDMAIDAWYMTYGTNNNHAGAIAIWRRIFGDEFPVYG